MMELIHTAERSMSAVLWGKGRCHSTPYQAVLGGYSARDTVAYPTTNVLQGHPRAQLLEDEE